MDKTTSQHRSEQLQPSCVIFPSSRRFGTHTVSARADFQFSPLEKRGVIMNLHRCRAPKSSDWARFIMSPFGQQPSLNFKNQSAHLASAENELSARPRITCLSFRAKELWSARVKVVSEELIKPEINQHLFLIANSEGKHQTVVVSPTRMWQYLLLFLYFPQHWTSRTSTPSLYVTN